MIGTWRLSFRIEALGLYSARTNLQKQSSFCNPSARIGVAGAHWVGHGHQASWCNGREPHPAYSLAPSIHSLEFRVATEALLLGSKRPDRENLLSLGHWSARSVVDGRMVCDPVPPRFVGSIHQRTKANVDQKSYCRPLIVNWSLNSVLRWQNIGISSPVPEPRHPWLRTMARSYIKISPTLDPGTSLGSRPGGLRRRHAETPTAVPFRGLVRGYTLVRSFVQPERVRISPLPNRCNGRNGNVLQQKPGSRVLVLVLLDVDSEGIHTSRFRKYVRPSTVRSPHHLDFGSRHILLRNDPMDGHVVVRDAAEEPVSMIAYRNLQPVANEVKSRSAQTYDRLFKCQYYLTAGQASRLTIVGVGARRKQAGPIFFKCAWQLPILTRSIDV